MNKKKNHSENLVKGGSSTTSTLTTLKGSGLQKCLQSGVVTADLNLLKETEHHLILCFTDQEGEKRMSQRERQIKNKTVHLLKARNFNL